MAVAIVNRDRTEAIKSEAKLYYNKELSPVHPEAALQHLVWCHQRITKMSNRKRKQVAGGTVPFKGEFSFVNKDASNIESKDHNAVVSFHVMNRYEKWKKQEQAKKLRASANVPIDSTSSAESSHAPGVRRQFMNDRIPAQVILTQTQQKDETTITPYPPEPWQVDHAEHSMLDQSGPGFFDDYTHAEASGPNVPSPQINASLPYMGGFDDVGSATQDQGSGVDTTDFPPLVARILSYASGIVIPSTWPNEAGKAKWTYEKSRTYEELATVTGDSCHALAMLCFYATLMASANNDKDLASQACFFQTQAMAELRVRVNSQSGSYEPATLRAILKLFSAETTLDNTSTARIHLKMLRNIVSAEGGVILLDSWFRENLLSADCYFALKYETRPLFPASEWTPGPLSQPWKTRLATARVTGDHAPGVDPAVEHATLRSIVTDLRELFRVERYVNSHDVPGDDQLLRWRQLRKFDCISRLADHQLNVKIYPHLYLRPKLQLAICAAVALMAALVLGSPEPVRFGLKLVTELRGKVVEAKSELGQELGEDEEDNESDATNVVYWLLYVGMLGEKTHPLPRQMLWLEREFLRASEELGLSTEKDQQDVTKQLLCSPVLFEEVHGKRSYRTEEARKGVYEACGMSWRQPLEPPEMGNLSVEEQV